MDSMTGFGKGEAVLPDGARLTAELSSVNRKQLELRLALPPELAELDPVARKLIANAVSRGSVQLKIGYLRGSAAGADLRIDEDRLQALVAAACQARRIAGLSMEVDVEQLMLLPGVVIAVPPNVEAPEFFTAFEQAVNHAIAGYQEMRHIEGEALKADFEKRLAGLEQLLGQIEPLVANIGAAIKARLLEKLAVEKIPTGGDDERLLKEVLFYADKSDVTEEITRLHSHFGQFRRFLTEKKPVGRSLDFLMQELFREITTLGNKAGIAEVSPLVVAFKSELEKLREQIQNVE